MILADSRSYRISQSNIISDHMLFHQNNKKKKAFTIYDTKFHSSKNIVDFFQIVSKFSPFKVTLFLKMCWKFNKNLYITFESNILSLFWIIMDQLIWNSIWKLLQTSSKISSLLSYTWIPCKLVIPSRFI